MRSMTGFGSSRKADGRRVVEAEARSVNNRFLKTQIKLSRQLATFEAEFESLVRESVHRGSVVLNLRVTDADDAASYVVNEAQARKHYEAATKLAATLGLDERPSLADLLGLPGVIESQDDGDARDAELLALGKSAATEALQALTKARELEGSKLRPELESIAARLRDALHMIRERAPSVVIEYRDRLKRRLTNLLSETADKVVISDTDLVKEVALMADRSDISEEIQRLSSHLDEFDRLIASREEVGRRLDFLIQEMLRETNTIASKAGDYRIVQKVVDAKSDIERLKEQVQNIE